MAPVISSVGAEPASETAGSPRHDIDIRLPEVRIQTGPVALLPDNPTDSQLTAFAESHPDVQKVLKVFRAKIIEVRKN